MTEAIVEWLLDRGRVPQQETLFDAGTLDLGPQQLALDDEWSSAAEREKASRTRYAQRSIHPGEVAREVAAIRDTLGRAGEVRPFVEHAAVARGEAALVRTDPVVGAYVLDAALDAHEDGARPARRCGVIRTRPVDIRTTLLLVRYRFRLTLPSRAGDRQLVAEDARLLAFTGSPANATWLPAEQALRLPAIGADENTDSAFAERTMQRVLDGLDATAAHLADHGDELAAELLAAHRRVRSASGEIVRGVQVVAQKPADVLGAYVYLPVTGAVRCPPSRAPRFSPRSTPSVACCPPTCWCASRRARTSRARVPPTTE